MKIKTTEEILVLCDNWMNNAKIERKGMMIEISNPIPLLNTKWVCVDDLIKEMDEYVDAYNGDIDQDAIDILYALKKQLKGD